MLKNILMLTTEEPNPHSTYQYYYPTKWGIPAPAHGAENVFLLADEPAVCIDPMQTLVIATELDDARAYRDRGYAILLQKENLKEATAQTEFAYVTDYPCDCSDIYLERVFCRGRNLPWRIVQTARLLIREITPEDVPALYDLYDDEQSRRFMEPLYEYEEELAYQRDYIRNMYGLYGYGMWVLIDRQSNRLIGRAGIGNREIDGEEWQELGYILHRDYRGKGLAYEACNAILAVASRLSIPRIAVVTDPANEKSLELVRKLGFKREAALDESNMVLYVKHLS